MNAAREWGIKLAVTVFFLGYCPIASGTLGAFAGLLLFLGIKGYFWLQIALILGLLFIGAWLSTLAEDIFHEKDSHRIVLDEVVGFLITMVGIAHPSWAVLIIGFVLNRIFDIYKPFPLKSLEKIPGGWGVMLDDVGAGIYANLALRLLARVC